MRRARRPKPYELIENEPLRHEVERRLALRWFPPADSLEARGDHRANGRMRGRRAPARRDLGLGPDLNFSRELVKVQRAVYEAEVTLPKGGKPPVVPMTKAARCDGPVLL